MKRVLLLVEGQTEEQFVKRVLQPHLWPRVHVEPKILVTKRVKNGPDFKGGITSFTHAERDLRRLLGDTDAALVSTMVDLYGLPSDFPGMSTVGDRVGIQKAEWIEAATEDYFGSPKHLKAFIAVHEFEALLFAGPEELASTLASRDRGQAFRTIRDNFETPEHINEGPDTHPARRITEQSPTYQKPVHGVQAAERIWPCPDQNRVQALRPLVGDAGRLSSPSVTRPGF